LYYLNQGKVEIPVPFLYESSSWAKEVLDKEIPLVERNKFFILITAQDDYFNWFTDYQALVFMDFNFFFINKEYHESLSDKEISDLFIRNNTKYIVKNSLGYDFSDKADQEHQKFFKIVSNSSHFKLIANKDNKYFIWQVY
ncbi:MAG: hypothetical protein V1892_01330, partial [bacterium]